MESVAPGFARQINKGDILVAGKNFGCGSSREHAAKALKYAGISAVIAESFARIFFRNAFNVGLLAIPLQGARGQLQPGQLLEVDLRRGLIMNKDTRQSIRFPPLPPVMLEILEAGGIIPYTAGAVG
jgi:3-isopropylmalate/(R)-2-methylmalate dehydratase small subunit